MVEAAPGRRSWVAGVAVTLLVASAGLLGFWQWRAPHEPNERRAALEAGAAGGESTPAAGYADPGSAVAPAGSEVEARLKRWRNDPNERLRARQAADATRERLRVSRQNRAARERGGSVPSEDEARPHMPPLQGRGNQVDAPLGHYIRDIVREQFMPMGKSCYEGLLAHSPRAGGKLVLQVVVAGESSIGGVVDDVSLRDDSTLDDEEFVTCVRESMYAVEFDAPPVGTEKVDFTYPLIFAPGRRDAGAP